VLGATAFAGIGLAIAARAKTLEAVSGALNLLMLPMWLGSGVFFSRVPYPDWLQPVLAALPLTPLVDALRGVDANNRGETQEGVANTAAIGRLLGEIAELVQHLDAVMHNKYARSPEKLRAWQSASRVERAPRRKREPAVTPPAAPPAPPAHGA
jgi:hypothetical protein